MIETVVVKREDLEYLKKCFEYLRDENEKLKSQIESMAEPEDIGIDLIEFEAMFKDIEEDEDENGVELNSFSSKL